METGNNLNNKNNIKKLSVFIYRDGFSFVKSILINNIEETLHQEYVKFDNTFRMSNFYELFEKYILKYDIKNENFDYVSIKFSVDKYVFVPEKLFDPGELETYYYFNIEEKQPSEDIFFTYSSVSKVYTLFAYDKSIIEALENHYHNAELSASISVFIDNCIENNDNTKDYSIFCNIYHSYVDVVVLNDGKLFLANTFSVKSNTDIAYYVLEPFFDLNLDGNEIKLNILGGESYKEAVDIIKKYVSNVELR